MAAGVLLAAFTVELLEPPEEATLQVLGIVLVVIILLTLPEVVEWWSKRKKE